MHWRLGVHGEGPAGVVELVVGGVVVVVGVVVVGGVVVVVEGFGVVTGG